MAGTDYRNGATTTSRTAEFSGGALGGSTGANYAVKQAPPQMNSPYQPSSVLSSIGGSGNGMSRNTFDSNRALQYYRT